MEDNLKRQYSNSGNETKMSINVERMSVQMLKLSYRSFRFNERLCILEY